MEECLTVFMVVISRWWNIDFFRSAFRFSLNFENKLEVVKRNLFLYNALFLFVSVNSIKKYHYSFSWLCNSQYVANFILRKLLILICSKAPTNTMNQILKGFSFWYVFCIYGHVIVSARKLSNASCLSFSSFAKKTFQDIELPKYKVN